MCPTMKDKDRANKAWMTENAAHDRMCGIFLLWILEESAILDSKKIYMFPGLDIVKMT